MQIIDISKDIADCEIYPGDPAVRFETISRIGDGGDCNLTAMYTGLHNGTHVDAPLHFIENGDSVDKADLRTFIGECYVIEAPQGAVTGEFVNKHFPPNAQRVLVKSGGKAWFLQSAAEEIAFGGIKLIGTDAMSVGTQGCQTETHTVFLRENVAIIENLELSAVKPGRYFLVAQPLKIGGAEAAPTRAVLLADYVFWSGTKI